MFLCLYFKWISWGLEPRQSADGWFHVLQQSHGLADSGPVARDPRTSGEAAGEHEAGMVHSSVPWSIHGPFERQNP